MAQKRKSDELDCIIQSSLLEFAEWIDHHEWFGREKEAVSLYVLGFLQKHCRPRSILSDATQIGIEVAVPQIGDSGTRRKVHVNKDLVIWGKPGMTCWDRMPAPDEKLVPKNWPLRIIEWKRAKSHRDARRDCEWLLDFCRRAPKSFCGYSVVLGAGQGEERIHCTRVSRDTVQENWI